MGIQSILDSTYIRIISLKRPSKDLCSPVRFNSSSSFFTRKLTAIVGNSNTYNIDTFMLYLNIYIANKWSLQHNSNVFTIGELAVEMRVSEFTTLMSSLFC